MVTFCSPGGLCVNHCQKVWNCFGSGCGWSWRRDSITSNNSQVSSSSMNCLIRNIKHVPCFYCVTEMQVEFWENEKCCEDKSWQAIVSTTFLRSPKLPWEFLFDWLWAQDFYCVIVNDRGLHPHPVPHRNWEQKCLSIT